MRYIFNGDKEHVSRIEKALDDNEGYCPCNVIKSADTQCMCKEFRDMKTNGWCHCRLFYKMIDGEDCTALSENNTRLLISVKHHCKDSDTAATKVIECGDWIDLRSAEDVEMKQGEFRIISLGVSMQLPKGYEAHVVPRSSTFKNWGILQTNSMGVIDESYCGNDDVWGFPALAMRNTKINKGDRICQFRIMKHMEPVLLVEVDTLDNENRGGFGSTGKD